MPDSLASAVAGCDVVVHTAAMQPLARFAPRAQFQAVNSGGTLNLLRAFNPPGEGRFLLMSTINVHGIPPPPGANAESPLKYCGDGYSDSKVDGERSAWNFAREHGIALTVVRPGCTFGPSGGAWTIQPIERIRRGWPVLVGDGRGICNWIFVDNLIDLLVDCLTMDAAAGACFIGCQSPAVKWREFFGLYGKMTGLTPRSIPYAPALLAGEFASIFERFTGRTAFVSRSSVGFYSHDVTFDVSKNERILGYTPRVTFKEAMKLTENWLRNQKLI